MGTSWCNAACSGRVGWPHLGTCTAGIVALAEQLWVGCAAHHSLGAARAQQSCEKATAPLGPLCSHLPAGFWCLSPPLARLAAHALREPVVPTESTPAPSSGGSTRTAALAPGGDPLPLTSVKGLGAGRGGSWLTAIAVQSIPVTTGDRLKSNSI